MAKPSTTSSKGQPKEPIDVEFHQKCSLVWSVIKVVVGIAFFVVAVVYEEPVFNIVGAIVICAALMLAIGTLNRVRWFCYPELFFAFCMSFAILVTMFYKFSTGVTLFFTSNPYGYVERGQHPCIKHFQRAIASEYILSSFLYFLLLLVSLVIFGMIGVDVENIKLAAMKKKESGKDEQQLVDVETGKGEKKLEDVDV